VLDDRFGRVRPDEPAAVGLGGPYTLSRWAVNIEHEDEELGQLEGVGSAAKTLLQPAGRRGAVSHHMLHSTVARPLHLPPPLIVRYQKEHARGTFL
jgi:hypothetical protein